MKPKKNFASRFFFTWMLAISLVAVMNSCKKNTDDNSPSSPPANEVWMQNTAFNPSTITINTGTTITWRNKDSMNHTVTSTSGSELNSGTIGGGATFTHQFNTAGTYAYHCTIHSGMTGQVVVH